MNHSLLNTTIIGFALLFAQACTKETPVTPPTPPATSSSSVAPVDKDGNTYKTVKIGTQTWFAENLKTTRYSNGDLIGTTTPAAFDISNETNPKYQWSYNGKDSNATIYGRLYTWYAIKDPRNVCPTGYHVPADSEWTKLNTNLGGYNIAGGKMKEIGLTHWLSPNTGATNSSGFTGLPGGNHSSTGPCYFMGTYGYWWSTREYDTRSGVSFSLDNNSVISQANYNFKSFGISVRCVMD
jgi:uncharacterized protein (TIGR02145 family)